jgi:two-component system, cell cycle sensor histidine kinase and response regulator CckA
VASRHGGKQHFGVNFPINPGDTLAIKLREKFRPHPFVAVLFFLALFSAIFFALEGRIADGVFIIGSFLPLIFALLFGLKWGLVYAIIHTGVGMGFAEIAGFSLARLRSHGIPSTLVMVFFTGAMGRIKDLTTSLRHELKERERTELELQKHKAQLESMVEERTADLVKSHDRLMQEMAERGKAERQNRDLAASLKRAEKMEAIGILAGSVAHDLNNTLGSIIGYPELLLLDLPENSPMRESLMAIRESGQRAAAIVQDLLTMARRGVTVAQVLDLNKVVADLMRSPELVTLRARRPEVRIVTELSPGLLHVHGSAVHMTRAVLNLVLNGMEAIEGQGRVELSTTNQYIDAPSRRYEVMTEGEYVALTVQDTGKGIAREDLDRIFEPFFTRKVMGRSGTGLGMAIVWGTVKDHNGFIDVRSEPGKGTTFTLFIPATREELQAEPAKLNTEDWLGHGESLLVVDDVPLQRDLCVAMLTKLGYVVAAVASGEEAVEFVRCRPVDLLILDMIMEPGIDGLETYKRIIAANPGQKAIIASGFSESQQVKAAQQLGAGAYIRKPYALDKLAAIVKGALHPS